MAVKVTIETKERHKSKPVPVQIDTIPIVQEVLEETLTFPRRLKHLRQMLGYSQLEMAVALGVRYKQVIYQWENGIRRPSEYLTPRLVFRWAEELDKKALAALSSQRS